jgi:hypothetical protein
MLILHNTQIFTLKEGQPTAIVLFINDHTPHTGYILTVGDDRAILNDFSQKAEVQDMGESVIPWSNRLTNPHVQRPELQHCQETRCFRISPTPTFISLLYKVGLNL